MVRNRVWFKCFPSWLLTYLMKGSVSLKGLFLLDSSGMRPWARWDIRQELDLELDQEPPNSSLYLNHLNSLVILFHQASHLEWRKILLISKGWFRAFSMGKDILYNQAVTKSLLLPEDKDHCPCHTECVDEGNRDGGLIQAAGRTRANHSFKMERECVCLSHCPPNLF